MVAETNQSILLIDDSRSIRALISEYLVQWGYRVLEAGNGRMGLERFEKEHPAVILVDLEMPEVSGMEVLRQVRHVSPDTPVIIISGTGKMADAVEVNRLGAFDYILKPIQDMEILRHAVEKALDHLRLIVENRNFQKRQEEILHDRTLAFQESEGRFQAVFEQAPLGIAILNGVSGVFEKTNQKFSHIIGYTPEEILQQSFRTVCSPGDALEYLEIRDLFLEGRLDTYRAQKLWLRKDGTEVWINLTIVPLKFNREKTIFYLVMVEDISRHKQAEEERLRLGTIVNQVDEMIVVADPSGVIQYVNPAFERISGYAREEVMGGNLLDFPVEQRNGITADSIRAVLEKGEVWKGHCISRKKDGSLLQEDVTITPVSDTAGAVANLVAIKRDATKETQLANRLQQVQKMEAIGTLAGGIAHDFNNILGAIFGYSELAIAKTKDMPAVRNYLDEVMKAAQRAKELVQQILTFSRQTEQEKKPVKPKIIVKEALKFLRASLPSTIEIKSKILSDSMILADSTQIHQIVMNLCSNASQAMKENGGLLEVVLEDVEADAELLGNHPDLKPGKYLKMDVSDTGVGIPAGNLDRIFDPFFTTKPLGEGTGMGLSVVHGIVTGNGGIVLVASKPGQGSVFTVLLPVIAAQASESGSSSPTTVSGKGHILFLDDEKDLVKLGKLLLESLGYHVTECTESLKALELFYSHPESFDLIVTDYTMPVLAGDRFAQEAKKIRPDIPILLCTGDPSVMSEQELEKLGVKDILSKPYSQREIAEKIKKVLEAPSW